MDKTPVTNICSVGIIFRAENPAEIFLEMKDDGHPIKLMRRQLCFIGGNWIGEEAKNDENTLDTFQRELTEELSFDRPTRNTLELALLGVGANESFMPTPQSDAKATDEDKEALNRLKMVITEYAAPFGDFLNTVPKSVLDSADPENKRGGFTSLASYWFIGLHEKDWQALVALQRKFGNLSGESITLITSMHEIIRTNTKTTCGHDRVLARFFEWRGLAEAKDLPLVPGLESVYVGLPLPSYREYLDHYEVAKKPV